VYQNHHIVRIFGAKPYETETFLGTNEKLFSANWKSQFLSGMMMPIMTFVGNLSYVLIFVVGVAFMINGSSQVTLGTIISFIIYARLFSQPLGTFAQSMTSLQQSSAAGKRVFEVLDAEEMTPERAAAAKPEQVRGQVEFDHVSFGYREDQTIIHDFSASISPGQKIAIVGPTGAGKTTMVNLLMRFYEVRSGAIRIDGQDIRDMTRQQVHDLFGMILQDTWLFSGTIRDNLVFNGTGVSDAQLDEACEAVGLTHFIRTQEKCYDTELSDKMNLSEGQKQQMTIARAIIQNAPMLILDEATSSIDTRTEQIIQNAMDRMTKGKTSFVIAHRLSTIRNADVILVMQNGDIVEQGSHEELIEKDGVYAKLYNSQFEQAV
jgi:ATP-binding cassette subfamily B protein